jgi:hypothetical protein
MEKIFLESVDLLLPIWRICGWFLLGFIFGRIASIIDENKKNPMC